MGGQVVAMEMRVGCMFWRERGLFQGFMFRMGKRIIERVVTGIFQVSPPVHAGS